MTDLVLAAAFVAGIILFVKHMQKLDAEIGAFVAKHQHMESNARGVCVFWVEPAGLFRYRARHEWKAFSGEPQTPPIPQQPIERRIVPPSQQIHQDAIFILTESAKRDASGRQFMRLKDFHPTFEARWRSATDYLAAEWGVVKHRVGDGLVAGTFLPSHYDTLTELLADVERLISPLPRSMSVAYVAAQHSNPQASTVSPRG
jgi:hypothetical protein